MSDAPAPIKLSDQDAKLLALYAEGLLTDEQARALNVRLHEAPELITIIAQLTEIEEHMRALLIEEQATERGDWYAVMTELAKAEAQAQTELVHLESDKPKTLKLRTDTPSLREIGWAIGYLGKQPRVWAPIAAALAIALTLVFIFAGNPNAAPIATTPNDSDKPVITDVRVVATLTAQHNAQWLGQAEGALAPGSQLRAGDRLTLTQGYAKVTTQRGAIAILEAPTSIELTDSDNAIRLQQGKLVGICETPSSKGFIVRTPHLDITDLGTRFGVTTNETTTVHVIEGEVEVATNKEQQPLQLNAGQAATLDRQTQRVAPVEAIASRFVYDWNAVGSATQLTGNIRYEPSMAMDLRKGQTENQHALLFLERSNFRLDRPVQVNLTAPGRYAVRDLPEPHAMQDHSVDSYFMHFDAVLNDAVTKRTVSITFERPILGVITASEQLAASHSTLGLPGIAYGNQSDWTNEYGEPVDGSGLEISIKNPQHNDLIQLSDDRKTLTLDMIIQDAIDQVRVLVQSEEQSD